MLIDYFLIPLAVSGLAFILILLFYKKTLGGNKPIVWISVLVFLSIYFFFVFSAYQSDVSLQKELMALDLNQDGVFSLDEQTPAYFELLVRVNGVGRAFTIFTALIPATLISIAVGFIIFIVKKIRKSYKVKNILNIN